MESPGHQLRRAREAQSLDLRDLARTTKIPRTSLELLEKDAYDQLPAEVFVRGFLRNLGRELKLDVPQLLSAYEQHTGRVRKPAAEMREVQDDPTTPPKLVSPVVTQAPPSPDRIKLPSFDRVVEAVGSTRPAYVIGTLLVLLGIALAVSVITNGLDYDQRLTLHDAPTHRASWDVKADGTGRRSTPAPSSLVGATTLDLIRDDQDRAVTAE